jgi:hypothetical protein
MHPNASQSIPTHPNASQSIPRHPKASQCIKTHQNASQCIAQCSATNRNALHPNASQRIPTHPNALQSIAKHHNVTQRITTHWYTLLVSLPIQMIVGVHTLNISIEILGPWNRLEEGIQIHNPDISKHS